MNNTPTADLQKKITAKRAAVTAAREAHAAAAAAHDAALERAAAASAAVPVPPPGCFRYITPAEKAARAEADAAHAVRIKAFKLVNRREYALARLLDIAAAERDAARRAEAAAPNYEAALAAAVTAAKPAAVTAATPEARLAAAQAAFDTYAAARTAEAVAAGIDPECDPRPATAEGKRLAVALALARAAVTAAPVKPAAEAREAAEAAPAVTVAEAEAAEVRARKRFKRAEAAARRAYAARQEADDIAADRFATAEDRRAYARAVEAHEAADEKRNEAERAMYAAARAATAARLGKPEAAPAARPVAKSFAAIRRRDRAEAAARRKARADEARAAFMRAEAEAAPEITAEAKRAEAEAGARAMLAAAPAAVAEITARAAEAAAHARTCSAFTGCEAGRRIAAARIAAAEAACAHAAAGRMAEAAAALAEALPPKPEAASAIPRLRQETEAHRVALCQAGEECRRLHRGAPAEAVAAVNAAHDAAEARRVLSLERLEITLRNAEAAAPEITAEAPKPACPLESVMRAAVASWQAAAPAPSGVDFQMLVNADWNARCEVQAAARRVEAACREQGMGSPGHRHALTEHESAVKRAADIAARLAAARLRLA